MLIAAIAGATRRLGAPKDWNEEAQGQCMGLPILDTTDAHGNPVMVSAWQPTPDELRALNAGAPVYLWVYSVGHPPVMLTVDGATS